MQLAPQSFGQGDPAPHDDHVDVGRRAAKAVVAHVTAADKGPPRYTNDGLHLMGEGYLAWKEVIEKYVK